MPRQTVDQRSILLVRTPKGKSIIALPTAFLIAAARAIGLAASDSNASTPPPTTSYPSSHYLHAQVADKLTFQSHFRDISPQPTAGREAPLVENWIHFGVEALRQSGVEAGKEAAANRPANVVKRD